jgi:dTMP kinase
MPEPYIIFEGIDGTGKSTQSRLLGTWLRYCYERVVHTAEPHYPQTRTSAAHLQPDARALVYEADRMNWELNTRSIREPSWAIIQDRSFYSTLAYQDPSQEIREFILRDRFLKPDAVIYLDAPAEALRSRLEARGVLDEYEYDVEFQEAVRERYRGLNGHGCPWFTVDALQSVGAIHDQITAFVDDWLISNEPS